MEQQQATTPTDVAAEPSFDDKLEAKLFGEPEAPAEQPEPTPEAPAEEATPDVEEVEVPEEPEQQDGFVEIKHNGQLKRVSQEEVRNLAQKGFDYETNMAAIKADRQRLQSIATALQAQASVQPQRLEALAEAKAYERALNGYKDVDWVRKSQEDPVGAFQERTQFDTLVQGYNAAVHRANQLSQQEKQAADYVTQEQLALEAQKLHERIPEWKDPARYEKDRGAILQTLEKDYGLTVSDIPASVLADHRAVALIRDAYLYRQAVSNAKAKKGQLQGLPAVPKPGAKPAVQMDAKQVALKKLHTTKDPQAKKDAFDVALRAKLARFGL